MHIGLVVHESPYPPAEDIREALGIEAPYITIRAGEELYNVRFHGPKDSFMEGKRSRLENIEETIRKLQRATAIVFLGNDFKELMETYSAVDAVLDDVD